MSYKYDTVQWFIAFLLKLHNTTVNTGLFAPYSPVFGQDTVE